MQVFKYPALACCEQGGQRPRTIFPSFLGDAMRRYTGVSSSRLLLDAMAIYTPEGDGVIGEGVA